MKEKQFSKELGSYVSFALKTNPATTLSTRFVDNKGNISGNPQPEMPSRLTDSEMGLIESLLEKYSPLKGYLPAAATLNTLDIGSDHTKEAAYQKPGFEYKAVAVNRNQLEIAQYVSKKVEDIHALFMMGEHGLAKTKYLALQDFLANTRASLIGEYKSVEELEESVGMHAVGSNAIRRR